jgi:hypothetical protein
MFVPIAPGTPVEVRSTFDHAWKRGFVIAGTDADGYRLRRLSDGSVLPASFPSDVVRPVGWSAADHAPTSAVSQAR